MRPAVFALLLASCIHAQQLSFQGTVMDAVSHQPMAGVHVILRQADPQKASEGIIFGAISTNEGKFSFQSLASGMYRLEAKYNGYLLIPAKRPDGSFDNTVNLKPGEDLQGFSIKMTPHAVVAGYVFDENGDPMPHVPVIAQSVSGNETAQTNTDDRGQYRLPLAPGTYYITAMAQEVGHIQMGVREIRTDGAVPPVFGNTFYRSALAKETATAVDLGPGQHANDIDIHLTPLVSLTISGTVSGLPKGEPNFPEANITLTRIPANDRFGPYGPPQWATVGPGGEFTLEGVAPGHYWIVARSMDGEVRSAPTEIVAGSSNLTNLALTLVHGETLAGTVQIEGDAAQSTEAEKLTVFLEPVPGGPNIRADVDADGGFHLDHVFPGKFNVGAAPLPENAWIKSVKTGATESPDRTIDLTGGVSGVHIGIVVNRNGGQIEGAVLNKDGQPSDLPFPLVALAEAGAEPELQQSQPGTKFKYTGLRPGKYRLIAVDPGQLQGNTRDALKALLSKASDIEVHEKDRISQDLKIADVEASDAK